MPGYFNLPFSVRISNSDPIDGDRYISSDASARDALITIGRAHVGLQSYVLNESKLYILDSLTPPVWKFLPDSSDLNQRDVSIAWLLNNKVNRAGDTMTGNLTINDGGLVVTGDVSIIGGDADFAQHVHVHGNLEVDGSIIYTNIDAIEVSTAFILLNTGLVGPPSVTLQSGIVVERGSSDPYVFVYDEDEQNFRIGISHLDTSFHYSDTSTQAVSTREDSPFSWAIPFWNPNAFRFDTSAGLAFTNGGGLLLPMANNQPLEFKALMWNGTTVGSRDLSTMAFETSTNYYSKPEVDAIIVPINASIVLLRAEDSSLDASIGFLYNWDLSQDASIVALRAKDGSLDASLGYLNSQILQLNASTVIINASINKLNSQVLQLNSSIVRIDASLNDTVDGYSIFFPNASIGAGLVWGPTHYLDVSIVLTNVSGSTNFIPKFNVSGNNIINSSLYAVGSTLSNIGGTFTLSSSGDIVLKSTRMDSTGNVILLPSNAGNPSFDGQIYMGDDTFSSYAIDLQARSSNPNIELRIWQKGVSQLTLGNAAGPVLLDSPNVYLANTLAVNYGKIYMYGLDSSARTKILTFNPDTSTVGFGTPGITVNGSIGAFTIFNGTGNNIQNSFFKQSSNQFTVADNVSNLVITSGASQGNLILKTTNNGYSDFILDPQNGYIMIGQSQTTADIRLTAGGTLSDVNFNIQPAGAGRTKLYGGLDFPSIAEVSANKILYYDSSTYHVTFGNAPLAVTTLSALTDVSISGLADQNLLQYDVASGKWKNIAPLDASAYFQKKVVYNSIPGSVTTGSAGDVVYDSSYLYVCTSTNKWGRVLLDYAF